MKKVKQENPKSLKLCYFSTKIHYISWKSLSLLKTLAVKFFGKSIRDVPICFQAFLFFFNSTYPQCSSNSNLLLINLTKQKYHDKGGSTSIIKSFKMASIGQYRCLGIALVNINGWGRPWWSCVDFPVPPWAVCFQFYIHSIVYLLFSSVIFLN